MDYIDSDRKPGKPEENREIGPFDLSDTSKRKAFVLQPERWASLSTFAYASFLHVGRGAVLIDLNELKTEYVIRAAPGEKPNFSEEMVAEIEAYNPAEEVVCVLVFRQGGRVKASFNRYSAETRSPETSYHHTELVLDDRNAGATPKMIMDLAWLGLQTSFRLN